MLGVNPDSEPVQTKINLAQGIYSTRCSVSFPLIWPPPNIQVVGFLMKGSCLLSRIPCLLSASLFLVKHKPNFPSLHRLDPTLLRCY